MLYFTRGETMYQIPEFLIEKIKLQYPNNYEEIINGYKSNRVSSLRINTLKSNYEEITTILKEHNIEYNNVSWYDSALIINDDLNKIKELDIYKNGKVYFADTLVQHQQIVTDLKNKNLWFVY